MEKFAERLVGQQDVLRKDIMDTIIIDSDVRYGEQTQDRASAERVYQAFQSLVKGQ